jgi:hypothetical protein
VNLNMHNGYVIPVTTAYSRFEQRDKLSRIWLLEAIESLEDAADRDEYSHIADDCRAMATVLRVQIGA